MTREIRPAYLSISEGVIYSGLSRSLLHEMIVQKKLTAYRPTGGKALLSVAELDALIQAGADAPATRGHHLNQVVAVG